MRKRACTPYRKRGVEAILRRRGKAKGSNFTQVRSPGFGAFLKNPDELGADPDASKPTLDEPTLSVSHQGSEVNESIDKQG